MMKKLCAKQGCNKLVEIGQTYCEVHQKEYEEKQKQRHREYKQNRTDVKEQKFYVSDDWQIVRNKAISRDHGLCQLCLAEGRITFYDLVHHIQPIKTVPEKKLDLENLICLCESCHQKVHKLLRENPDAYWEIMDKIKKVN